MKPTPHISQLFPGIRGAIGLTALLFALFVFFQMIALFFWTMGTCLITRLDGKPTSDLNPLEIAANSSTYIYMISAPIAFAIIIGIIYYLSQKNSRQLINLKKLNLSYLFPTLLLTLGTSIISSEICNITSQLIPNFFAETMSQFLTLSPSAIIATCIIAPLAEEFLFRGCFLKAFLTRYKVWTSILVSALLFGVFHINPIQIPYCIFIGIVLGWLYYKTSSIWLCVIAHMINNSLCFIALYLSSTGHVNIPGFIQPEMTLSDTYSNQPLWLTGIGIALTVSGIIWIKKCSIPEDNLTYQKPIERTIKPLEKYSELETEEIQV